MNMGAINHNEDVSEGSDVVKTVALEIGIGHLNRELLPVRPSWLQLLAASPLDISHCVA